MKSSDCVLKPAINSSIKLIITDISVGYAITTAGSKTSFDSSNDSIFDSFTESFNS